MVSTSCGNPAGCSGSSSYGDLKQSWKATGAALDEDEKNHFPPTDKELRSKTPWLVATQYFPGTVCAGVIRSVSWFQLYKCVPATNGRSLYYSVTLSNLGPLPQTQVYVDQYAQSNCTGCTTCGANGPPIATIPAGLRSVCAGGGVTYSWLMVQNLQPGGVEGVPPLMVTGFTTTRYYGSNVSCVAAGTAPEVIRAVPSLDAVTYLPVQCPATPSCAAVATPIFTGYATSSVVTQYPALPVGTSICPTYPDLNYLGFLTLLVCPLMCVGYCCIADARRRRSSSSGSTGSIGGGKRGKGSPAFSSL
jgi:hypothetical protein